MNFSLEWKKYRLNFLFEAGTSRGVMTTRDSYFVSIREEGSHIQGYGEAAPLPGLSIDSFLDIEKKLAELKPRVSEASSIDELSKIFRNDIELEQRLPSLNFALEMASIDLQNSGERILFPSAFTNGEDSIPINGLIWMGDKRFMFEQIKNKLEQGFTCLKMKIGAIDFQAEYELLRYIREQFSPEDLILRVDANGAFKPAEATNKLKQLAKLHLHSIEQPVATGLWEEMHVLCKHSPVPIALDEELIGITAAVDKSRILSEIEPQYIILKPSLVGGFHSCNEWIDMAERAKIGWWITSALESNIGLNAISQYTYNKGPLGHQGLGTGQLFSNNITSPLEIVDGQIRINNSVFWNLSPIE
jgi:o-succinylbenzoate synthase